MVSLLLDQLHSAELFIERVGNRQNTHLPCHLCTYVKVKRIGEIIRKFLVEEREKCLLATPSRLL